MKKRILVASVAAALAVPAFAQTAPSLELLQKQIADLQQQLTDLKNQQEAQSKEVVMKGDAPGSYRRAGEETSVRLYGFARADVVHNFGGRNNASTGDYAAYQPSIALTGSPNASQRGETYAFVRASRLGAEAVTPTSLGALNVKVEGDFYNTGSSGLFRLRHAYGQLGSWIVGQTWSTFMDLDSTPETVDFNGPTGNTSLRQPQIRYTYATPNAGNFSTALEFKANGGNTSGEEFNRVPDLVVRWDKAFDWGHLALRGVTTENAYKSETVTAAKRGYGVGLGGSFKATETTTLLASSTYGKGLGRFFNESVGTQFDSTVNEASIPKELGVVVGVHQKLSDTLRGSVTYGQQRTLSGVTGDSLNRFVQSGTIGLIWAPVANVELGSEFMLSRRETIGGQSGTEPRLNFAATYSFGN
ncbi:MAG: DcaP family trimeric outer membrane transporter [Candidatus Dactylopiibacterium sp.]|nr:DcaP family trimeric outer membrane transporter [Candidatus Dactylopiibacterium sp.]